MIIDLKPIYLIILAYIFDITFVIRIPITSIV